MKDDKPVFDMSAPPTSYSAFKPVGHTVIGFPDDESSERAQQLLSEDGVQGLQQKCRGALRAVKKG